MYKACKKICLKSLYTTKLFNKKLETKKSPQKSSAAPGSESSSNHLLGERRDGHGENEMNGERETSKDVTGYSLTREWEERESKLKNDETEVQTYHLHCTDPNQP